MNCSLRSLSLSLCAATAAASLTAQDPGGPPAPAPIPLDSGLTPIHTQADDSGFAYGLWGAGQRYKASFHAGATFVPYLGRSYPETQSLRWHTRSAKVGTAELVNAGAPQPSLSEFRAEYDLGGIVEAWDIRAEGLEQTFVLSARPAATGDLVITGEIETALVAAARAAAHAPLVFADAAGTPIASYGAATAIDANGRRRAMTTAFEHGEVTLALDGAWLADAAYPVVVDPMLGVLYSITGAVIEDIDLVRDSFGTAGHNWRAGVRWAAVDDADLWLRRFNDDGSGDTLVYNDITASWSAIDCSLGVHRQAACVLLAFARHFSDDTRKVRFHKHLRADFTLQTNYGSVFTSTSQGRRPDVATDLTSFAPASLLVVFQQENGLTFYETNSSEVRGVLIDLTGAGSAGVTFPIADTIFTDNERPQVGQLRSGSGSAWTVASQVIGTFNNPHVDWDVELRRVDRQANVSAPTVIGLADGWHQMAPRLAGFGGEPLVVYPQADSAVVGTKPSEVGGMEIVTRRMNWNGSSFYQPYGHWKVAINADPRAILTGVGFDSTTNSHYVVSYRSTTTDNVYLNVYGYRGYAIGGATTVFPAGGSDTTVSGAVAYDDAAERFLVAYGVNSGSGGETRVDAYVHPSAPAPTLSGLGCSAAQLSWEGSQLIGDADCAVRLDGLPNGALSTILVGTQPFSSLLTGLPIVHPGCWLLVPNTGVGSIGTLPIAFGPSISYDIDLPEWLTPFTLYFQGVHFDAAGNEVFTTQRLAVPLVR
ncbi:MAG: hypothetical protein KDE27_21390 [Planctomycetes bacterium]|nr:hypothetical protein [Planctomycetota bacterium]